MLNIICKCLYRSPAQCQLDSLQVQGRHPALGDEALLRHIQIEQVQRVVDGLNLAHLHEPVFDVLGGSHENAVTVVLRLSENLVKVTNGLEQLVITDALNRDTNIPDLRII